MRAGHPPFLAASLLLGLLLLPGSLRAQATLALEVRGGASIPAGSFTEGPRQGGELEAAPAFGLDFTLRRGRWGGLYVGFSQLRFGCAADGCRPDGSLVSTAWDVGGHVRLQPGPWGPWIRLGLLFARVESELPPGSDPAVPVSDMGLGGELGLGWRIQLRDGYGLNPGIRYTLLDARLDPDTVMEMRYWVADLALVLGF